MSRRVLVAGCGYVGLALGQELALQGHQVYGLRRSAGLRAELETRGIIPLIADITQPAELARLPTDFEWVVNCVASSGGDTADYQRLYYQGTRHLLDWLKDAPLRRFVYTSSTSVYGQNDGSLVEESSPAEPAVATGQVLVQTEQLLLEAARLRAFPAVILRLAGIYGPGRGYWFKQFVAGQARLQGQGQRLLNMVHRDDVVGAILAALQSERPASLYNVADDEPVSQVEFLTWLAAALGRSLPPAAAEAPDQERRRGLTNKRVSNRRLKAELGYRFKYPTFREGYAAQVQRVRDSTPPETRSC